MNLGLRASKRGSQVFVGEEEDESSQDPKGNRTRRDHSRRVIGKAGSLASHKQYRDLDPSIVTSKHRKTMTKMMRVMQSAVLEGTSQLEAITHSGREDGLVHSAGPHNPQAPSGPRWVAWQSSQAVSFVNFAKDRKLLIVVSFYSAYQVLRGFGVVVGTLEIWIWGRRVWKADYICPLTSSLTLSLPLDHVAAIFVEK